MHRTSSGGAIHSLVLIALLAATSAPTIGGDALHITLAGDRITGSEAVAPPLVVAQGRCFNGRCY